MTHTDHNNGIREDDRDPKEGASAGGNQNGGNKDGGASTDESKDKESK